MKLGLMFDPADADKKQTVERRVKRRNKWKKEEAILSEIAMISLRVRVLFYRRRDM